MYIYDNSGQLPEGNVECQKKNIRCNECNDRSGTALPKQKRLSGFR